MEAFDDIYRFLTEKTYPQEMEKNEKRKQLPTKGLSARCEVHVVWLRLLWTVG